MEEKVPRENRARKRQHPHQQLLRELVCEAQPKHKETKAALVLVAGTQLRTLASVTTVAHTEH